MMCKINSLHPSIRSDVRSFLFDVRKHLSVDLVVTHAYRSFREQDTYFEIGRTASGNIVTYAKGGESYHNYGLAFDVKSQSPRLTNDFGEVWVEIGDLGKSYNFEWGGDFSNLNDYRHFQRTYGYHHRELLQMLKKAKNQYYLNLKFDQKS